MNYTNRYLADLERIRGAVPDYSRLSGSRVLITGAGGLICSALVDFLLSLDMDIQVYAAGRSVQKLRGRFSYWSGCENLHYVNYDALEPLWADGRFDYYIHGASPANPASYAAQPVETMLANLTGMENILRHAKAMPPAKIIP